MKRLRKIGWMLASLLLALMQTHCDSLGIDQDLSDCAAPKKDFRINYELWLVTNLETELRTVLDADIDVVAQNELRNSLKGIFTDFAEDVDLSFYDVNLANDILLHREEKTMDASERSYALSLSARQYHHLAIANIKKNMVAELLNNDFCHTSTLKQQEGTDGVVPSQQTGLFTARLPIDIVGDQNQTFNVSLYMANCAAALLLDKGTAPIASIDVKTKGFAVAFEISDSIYRFVDDSPLVQANSIPLPSENQYLFCSVNFPSRNPLDTRMVIDSQDPFMVPDADKSLWQYQVDVTLTDGSVTRSVLGMQKPILAGQLVILKAFVKDDGTVQPVTSVSAGASVAVDWTVIKYPDIPLGR